MIEPAPTAVTGHHLPALNGLRAVAVFGVVAYHLGFHWASGGYLGVDLFFVLSGFLITSLLLEEWVRTAALNLVDFWGRRAKRLLPALFLVVGAIGLYLILNGRFGGPGANGLMDLSELRGDAIATLLYVGNWHAIYAGQSYFAQFSAPSPLEHTWSLAIEEQFYLIWPPVLLVVLHTARRWRAVGLALAGAGALASAGLMALLYHPGADPTRVYYGTDTRAFDLMAGAAVAFVAAARAQPGPTARRALHVAGPLAAVVLGVFWVRAGTPGGLPKEVMFEGGFLVCAVLAALVVADARLLEQGPLARALSVRPVHFIGTISYGIYLWHWPVILFVTGARTGLGTLPLDLVRVAGTVGIATASYYAVERPIRRAHFAGPLRLCLAPAAGIATAVVLVVATVPAVADPAPVAGVERPVHPGALAVAGVGGYAGQRPIAIAPGTISPAHPLRVAVIGDSVMGDASYGIRAALDATGEVNVDRNTFDGFGLTTVSVWPSSLDRIIATEHPQLIIGTWSWDAAGPTTPNALHQPKRYAALLERALRLMLAPGDGVDGVMLTQFPKVDVSHPAGISHTQQVAGLRAWNAIAASMPAVFPGRVMYLPVADSILLDGRYSTWLPPLGDPDAPRDQWVRVRKLDRGHLCPEGSARYADAILSDLTTTYHLSPADPRWITGAWVHNPDFNTPPGACPDDHPPG